MNDRSNLVERIKSALENPGDRPWLPDLTGDLVEMGWRALYEESGLSPSDYGTSRVIAKSKLSHRNVIGHLSTASTVEVLDERLTAYYQNAGIEFYSLQEIADTNLLSCVEDAIKLIKSVPDLSATVSALVRSFHLIKAQDDDYDISFSEPQLPFSVFVSLPQQRTPTTTLRVAEAIVHEAMHLQLTLIESILTLVVSNRGKYFSPWRREYRDAKGLLHALYVFRVIDQFLREMSSPADDTTEVYRTLRRKQIAEEVSLTRSFKDCTELTTLGYRFVKRLYSDVTDQSG